MDIQSVGNVSSANYSSQTNSAWSDMRKDLKGLDNSLLNGDLSGAQSMFAALQQAVGNAQGSSKTNSIMSQLGDSNSTLGGDMQAVSSALSANDLGGAQKAFAKLQQDMEAARQANGASHVHGGHHAHHAKANDGDGDDNGAGSAQQSSFGALLQTLSNSQSSGSSANDILSALQELSKANPKVAGDLATLITDLNNVGSVVNTKA